MASQHKCQETFFKNLLLLELQLTNLLFYDNSNLEENGFRFRNLDVGAFNCTMNV
jgi:hypothetical protein